MIQPQQQQPTKKNEKRGRKKNLFPSFLPPGNVWVK
jgi:hypothetical protein